ncbi:ester cyclase [Kitasatospora sp. NPDC093550]|uniref:ester cyclase n=1 Tax=Kitasatospora sp. NPDC093550 TaxID=3364089 RepID=UPI00382A08A6
MTPQEGDCPALVGGQERLVVVGVDDEPAVDQHAPPVQAGDVGAPATGNPMNTTAVVIHRIENGRLAEKWSDKDELGLLQQIGNIPPRSGPAE